MKNRDNLSVAEPLGFAEDINGELLDHFNIIAEKIASSSGIEQTLKQIARSASKVLCADPVVLFQYDKNKGRLLPPPIFSGKLFEEKCYVETFVFTGDTIAERIVAEGKSLYFERADAIDRHPSMSKRQKDIVEGRPGIRFHKRERIKSMAALVLDAEDETVGLMFLNYRTHQEFSKAVRKLMKTFAAYAAIAIKNSRLIETLRHKEAFLRAILNKRKILRKQLYGLNRATISLLNAESLEKIYDIVLKNLSQVGYDKGMIALVDETTKSIVGQRAIGENWKKLQKRTNVPLDSGDVLARVVRDGKPRLIPDTDSGQNNIRKAGIQSQYITPLIVQDKVIGTLHIDLSDKIDLLKADQFYFNENRKLLSVFANQVATAIEANRQKITVKKLQTTLADIGHEFRSPLHNIISQLGGLTYHLKKTYGDDEKVLKIAKIIEEETFRGERQMKNALFSAGESFESMGKFFEEGDIGGTVLLCADRFRETARKRGITIIADDSVKKLPAIYYDKTQMEQVFTNLIDNAVKYSDSNQNIEIKGADRGRKVEISIKDIGLGIPKRSSNQIFEGFTRSKTMDSKRFIPGTGLGLRIAKECVENHRGEIFVTSKPPLQDPRKIRNYEGYATIFTVMLLKNPKEH